MSESLLPATLAGAVPASGEGPGLRWRGLAEGLLELVPENPAAPRVLLSAGIHGDETAPIEVLDALVGDLQAGRLPLAAHLLVVLGNPAAMRAGERYLDEDMNRLFAGRRQGREDTREARRAARIEAAVAQFVADACGPAAGGVPVALPVHYDLHTAIRGSRFERFGLLPFNGGQPYPRAQLDWLAAAGLEALLINHAPAGTFAYHTAATCGAASCTLELGKVRPFGDNDLSRFAGIDRALRALVSGRRVSPPAGNEGAVPLAEAAAGPAAGVPARPRVFRVVGELAKSSAAFELLLADDVDNFTAFPRGTVIARDGEYAYVVQHDEERIVFPNRTVKPGLRAGLMVVEVPAAALWG